MLKLAAFPSFFFGPLFHSCHTKEFFLSTSLPFFSASLCPRRGQKENIIPSTCVILTTPWASKSIKKKQPAFSLLPRRSSLVVSTATIIVIIVCNDEISENVSTVQILLRHDDNVHFVINFFCKKWHLLFVDIFLKISQTIKLLCSLVLYFLKLSR